MIPTSHLSFPTSCIDLHICIDRTFLLKLLQVIHNFMRTKRIFISPQLFLHMFFISLQLLVYLFHLCKILMGIAQTWLILNLVEKCAFPYLSEKIYAFFYGDRLTELMVSFMDILYPLLPAFISFKQFLPMVCLYQLIIPRNQKHHRDIEIENRSQIILHFVRLERMTNLRYEFSLNQRYKGIEEYFRQTRTLTSNLLNQLSQILERAIQN